MKLKLVKAELRYQKEITEMLDEWYGTREKIVPYAIRRLDYHDFENYYKNLDVTNTSGVFVPTSTFFCLDEDRNIMVGAVNIKVIFILTRNRCAGKL